MGKLVNFFQKTWPIALIALFAVLLRLVKLEELLYFTYDEEIPAFVGRRLILWQHIPLIGGATPFGFHLGPYFYWFYAVLLFIGKLNPVVWGFAGAVLSTVTTLLIYIVGKNFFSKKVGISAAILWAFSALANVYDRHLWALTWGPITCLLVLYCLQKLAQGAKKFIYPLALTIGLAVHADPSNLVFLGLILFTFLYYKLPLKKNLAVLFIAIIVFTLPLVIFDIRHNFANLRPTLNFIKAGRNTPALRLEQLEKNTLIFPQAAARLVYAFGDGEVAKQYSYCRNYIAEKFATIPLLATITASLALILFVFVSFKYRRTSNLPLISSVLILYFFGIFIYGTILNGDIFEHYLTGAFPVFLLIAAFFISRLPKKLWLITLAIFVSANLYKLSTLQNSQGLKDKRQAIEYTMQQVGDKPFSLDSLSTCWKWNGYRYLFTVFGREPVKSYVDPNFGYLYETTPIWNYHPDTVVAFVVHDFAPETAQFYRRYAELKSHEMSSKVFGNIEVIVMNNSANWFK